MADFARESMMEMFTYETSQLLEQLDQTIMESEETEEFNSDTINEIFRIMHTIKGSAAMMLFGNIQQVAHSIEDLFYYIREHEPKVVDYSKLADIVLHGSDFVKNELEKIENGNEANGVGAEILDLIKEYLALLKGEAPEQKENQDSSSKQPVSNNTISSKEKSNGDNDSEDKEPNCYRAIIYFEDGCEMENIRSYTVVHNLEPLTIELYHIPQDIIENESTISIIQREGFKIYLTTTKDYSQIEEVFSQTVFLRDFSIEEVSYGVIAAAKSGKIEDNIVEKDEVQHEAITEIIPVEKSVEPIEPVEQNLELNNVISPEQSAPKDSSPKKAAGGQMISVAIGKLDLLLNLVGELVISEAMVTQNPELAGLELENFYKAARQLHKIINDVQDTVMSMRMVPLSNTFFKMHRIVRDMCKQLGKDVQLEIVGDETEVDKNIIEHISDPLMHIIRNSVDHGIEMPDVRKSNGKPSRGTILLEAKNTGGDVLIIVKDDGQGLDKEAIMKKAMNNGLLRKNASDYSEKEIFSFIFLPGFSTNVQVTNYSGRGVGMDVVTTNIDTVGGSVLVDSVRGEGTTFTLKIPLTLAIIDGMVIKLGKAKYTIPITSIKQSFKAKQEDIFMDPDGNEMIMVRGEAYNIVRLNEFFGINTDAETIDDGILIMLENEEQIICAFADELIGEQQVVVKVVPKYIKKIRGISGCTLMGNGDISLIVDVAGFFNN